MSPNTLLRIPILMLENMKLKMKKVYNKNGIDLQ